MVEAGVATVNIELAVAAAALAAPAVVAVCSLLLH